MRELPGSVRLAHARNPSPDMVAAHQAGVAARSKTASTCGRVQAQVAAHMQRNAYKAAHRAELQRQYDHYADMPRVGCTARQLNSFFFDPIDCSELSPAALLPGKSRRPGV